MKVASYVGFKISLYSWHIFFYNKICQDMRRKSFRTKWMTPSKLKNTLPNETLLNVKTNRWLCNSTLRSVICLSSLCLHRVIIPFKEIGVVSLCIGINISTVIVNDSMEIHQQVTLHYNAEERHLSVQVHGYRIKVHTKCELYLQLQSYKSFIQGNQCRVLPRAIHQNHPHEGSLQRNIKHL